MHLSQSLIVKLFLALVFTLSLDAITLEKEEKEWLKAHPHVTMAGSADWLPYEAFNNRGDYIGIISGYLEYIESTLGIKIHKTPAISWSETLKKALEHEVMMVTAPYGEKILTKEFIPIKPFLKNPIVVTSKKGTTFVHDLNGLVGKKVAIEKWYDYTEEIYDKYPSITFVTVSSARDGFEGVSTGLYDAMLSSLASASYSIKNLSLHNLNIVGKIDIVADITIFVDRKVSNAAPNYGTKYAEHTRSTQKQDKYAMAI